MQGADRDRHGQLRHPRTRRHRQQRVQREPLLPGQRRMQRLPQPLRRGVPFPRHQPGQPGHPGQQHIPFPQPPHRISEDRLRAVPGHPRPPVGERRELALHLGEVLQRERLLNLSRVLTMRGLPHGVPLQARRISDLQLPGQEVDDLGWHPIQLIHQKPADIAHRGELDAEPQPVVIFPLPGHQLAIGIVQVEEPLQVRQRHRAAIAAEGRRFLVTEELHRHGLHRRTEPPQPGQ